MNLRAATWILPVALTAATYLVLFFLVPYSEGYLGGRRSITTTVWSFWMDYEDWQHGMLVPFLVGFMIWFQRKALALVPIKGSNWGIVPVLLGLGIYWIGYVIDHHYVGFISAQILIAGLIIWFLGWKMMQALFFPWAFLAFTWPFLFLESLIAFPLRMFLSDLAFHFLNAIGLPSVKVGSAVVSAPIPQLQVASGSVFAIDIADPCSGIRSVFALLMVNTLLAYFSVRGGWQKLVVIAAAIPFAVLGNFVRILLLVFGSIAFGSEFAIGSLEHPSTFHTFAGYFVFVVAIGATLFLTKIVQMDFRAASGSLGGQRREDKGPPKHQEPLTDPY